MTIPDDDIPTYARLLWGRGRGAGATDEGSGRPGPKPRLDLHTIAAAGVRLADTGGLEAVSMRTVGTEIGVSSMAIYRYLSSKHELLQVMVDEALGPPPAALPAGSGWRTLLSSWAHADRSALQAHPWVLDVPFTEPSILPHQLQWMERGLAALADTGLGEQQKLSSLLLVDVYVRGQVRLALGLAAGGDAAIRWSGRLRALTEPRDFPCVTAAVLSGSLDDDSDFATDEFTFGLETVLDGIATRVGRRAGG